jgi:predicted  nucleic acid-binding Zn-ribbon protein
LIISAIASLTRTVNEINIKVIQEVATDIGALVKYTSDIKGRTAKIQRETEKIDENLDQIRTAVGNYQSKLKAAIAEIENEGIETENIMEVMS